MSNWFVNKIYLVSLLLIGIMLAACGPKPPPVVQANVNSARYLNPSISGETSPVVVNFYELRSVAAFNEADFFPLYQEPGTVLGQDLIDRTRLELNPEHNAQYKRQLSPETRYIGIIAAYRDLDNARWRAVLEVPDEKKVQLNVNVGTQSIDAAIS